jgi:hypothetical protein
MFVLTTDAVDFNRAKSAVGKDQNIRDGTEVWTAQSL